MTRTHQIAVQLDSPAFETLKRLSKANHAPYATIIALALACLEKTEDAPSGSTSAPLVAAKKPLVAYALLPVADRAAWKAQVRALRAHGESYSAISKRLFKEHGLTGADGLPVSASTVRSMAAV